MTITQGAEVTLLRLDRARRTSYNGPSPLASLLYLICCALAVPACGWSRRCWTRRKRGGARTDSGVSGPGSVVATSKRGGWRGAGGRGVEVEYEMEGLVDREDGYEWGVTSRERSKGTAGDMW